MTTFFLLAVSFLLGGIPSGYLITKRIKGVDIRNYGSGNPGAANVYRTVGKWAGWGTFFCDALKGAAAVVLAQYLASGQQYLAMSEQRCIVLSRSPLAELMEWCV